MRVMAASAFAVGTFGVLNAPGCGGSDTCEGQMSSSCANLDADLCAKAKGCHVEPGRCLPFCETPGVNCATSACFRSGNDCKSRCEGAADETMCASIMASLGGGAAPVQICQWGADGCKSPCASFTTVSECNAEPVLGCNWIECGGTPQGPCSSYSGDECPTFLGCDRVSHPGYSTQ